MAKRRSSESGQIVVLASILIIIFIGLAAAMIDVYVLLDARNWGYRASQQAALAGVSQGREWGGLTTGTGCVGSLSLNETTAYDAAVDFVQREMDLRGLTTYTYDVRVLPDPSGGSVADFPLRTVRLGSGMGTWTSTEPAVGVYLSFPVTLFLIPVFGLDVSQIYVFAAGGVNQPTGACP